MWSLLAVKKYVICINRQIMDIRSKLVIKNTIYMYLRLFLTLVIGFLTSRVILRVLGVEDFGIYNLVGGVVTLFVFVNQALSSSTQRYITYDLGTKNSQRLNATFSMCMNAHILFSLIIFSVLEIAGIIFLNGVLDINKSRLYAAHWVFQCMTISSILGILRVPYSSLITADEKFGFISFVGIVEPLLKLLILYFLVIIDIDKLILYSVLFMAVTLLTAIMYVGYCQRHYAEAIKFKIDLGITKMKGFLKFSGLSLYEQIAVVCSYQGVDILLNLYHGVVVNAAMGIAKQVQAAVFNFIASFQSAMSPQITKSYAAKDEIYLTKLMVSVPKYSLYLILVLSLPIIFNMNDLLKLWLVEYPEHTCTFCQLILVSCILESVSLPYRTLIYAEGRIVKYQLIIGTCFMLNLLCSYIFLFVGFQPEIVLIIRVLVYLLINVVRLMFYKTFHPGSFLTYLWNTYGRVFIYLVLCISLLIFINSLFDMNMYIRLIASFLSLLVLLMIVGINSEERMIIYKAVRSRIKF